MATPPPPGFQELLRFELQHTYFLDDQLPDLAVAPTRATTERLRRAGLLLRAQRGGFVLLWQGEGQSPAPAFRQYLEKRVFPLVFALQPRASAFHLYTDLPPPAADNCSTYCFESGTSTALASPNKTARPADDKKGRHCLAGPEALPLRPLVFDYYRPPLVAKRLKPVAPSDHAELWAQDKRLAVWPPEDPLQPARERALVLSSTTVTLNLRQWGSGRYQLRLEETTWDFYADDDLSAARAWGLLQVNEGALALKPNPIYVLQFQARRVYWQYHIQFLTSAEATPGPLTLEVRELGKDLEEPANFEAVSSPAPSLNVIFRSKNTISLKERYQGRQYELFTLHSATRGTEPKWRKLRSALPHADIQQLRTEGEGPVAEIFVRIRL
ncbi:MAG TPA: hypothetical protein VF629_07100 [Hymenobacter sp.]|jgi:hypothetical protein|uniref:hypothetical protein n=1 Tax=Hymenobacter sp. TaxID=1898978 RepID=UPI002ED96791